MGLGSFLFRRLLLTIPVFFGVTILTFVISHIIVPDPVAAWAGLRASPQTLAAIAARYHLNDPIISQYWYYMVQLFQGNLGISPARNTPVSTLIWDYLPATVELSIAALILSVLIGIPIGVLSALWNGKRLDYPLRVIYLSGIASPSFLLALIFQLVFAYYLRILPGSGELAPTLVPPVHITGMYIVDSLLTGNWTDLFSSVQHMILPAITLAALTFSIIGRVTRSSVLETINKDFIRMAKAKGLDNRAVTYRHLLRNALTSTVTVIGYAVQLLLAGTVVVESIFFWPGIGLYTTQSLLSLDFPSIMGVTVVFTLIVIVSNLAVDLSYGLVDPRVRYD